MKKLMLIAMGLMLSTSAFSQSCLDDVWQCLRQNQAPKAKKFLESCMAANPDNAQAWLMKGNVYINLFNMDQKKLNDDPAYTPRYPDALEIANEAFVKALQLDPKVQPKTGMLGAKQGQAVMADEFMLKANEAIEAKDNANALKYMALAAKGYELASSPNAAIAYFKEALIYRAMNDKANEKEMMLKVIKINPKVFAGAYTEVYYIYKDENDTVNCEKILKQAKSNVDSSLLKDLYEIELDFLAMKNDQEALSALCDKIMAGNELKTDDDILTAANCANYLTNYGAFEKAEALLQAAIDKVPNSFKLNEQMAYRYYQEMAAYDQQVKDLQAKKDWNGVIALQKADSEWSINRKNAIEKAHEWADKAFMLKDTKYDNLDNNRRLKQLKVLLGQPVPAELDEAIKARMQN